MAISVFYAFGTLAGGVGAPALFAVLIESGSREHLFWGYLGAAALMLAGAATEIVVGVDTRAPAVGGYQHSAFVAVLKGGSRR